MVMRLNNLLITNSYPDPVWISLMAGGRLAGSLFTVRYKLKALPDKQRIHISNQQPEAIGEGGEFSPAALAGFLLERIALPGPEGELTVEVGGRDFDALVGEFYNREF